MASKGHKDVVRRTWDTEQYEQRAKQREAAERAGKRYRPEDDREKDKEKSKEPGSIIGIDKEGHMVRKDMAAYNFYDMVGQRRVVSAENALSEQGFYCEHCDKLCKDHKSYLEHCNKPKHLAKVGLPSEVRRADVDDVKGRLAAHLKAKKDGGEQQRKIQAMEESRRKALEQLKGKVAGKEAKKKDDSDAEDAKKKQKKDKKKQKESAVVVDEKLDFDAGAMGLPMGFGSSKK